MSAHVVSKFDIDLLVRAAVHGGRGAERFRWWKVDEDGDYVGWREIDEFAERNVHPSPYEKVSPSQLGQMLVDACVASVGYRYQDTDPDRGDLPGPTDAYYMGPYVYENPGYTLSPGEVFRTIDYYDYQSCEHPDWRKSEAYAFLRSLRESYCAKVAGYESAPWGWDDPSSIADKPKEFSRRII